MVLLISGIAIIALFRHIIHGAILPDVNSLR